MSELHVGSVKAEDVQAWLGALECDLVAIVLDKKKDVRRFETMEMACDAFIEQLSKAAGEPLTSPWASPQESSPKPAASAATGPSLGCIHRL
jgi:hypothetical protein